MNNSLVLKRQSNDNLFLKGIRDKEIFHLQKYLDCHNV